MNLISSTILYIGFFISPFFKPPVNTIGDGEQPQISADTKGNISLVFGQEDKIYWSTSGDNGGTFSKPALIGQVPQMHLGMARGPQIACSANYSIITAMDRSGNIHCYRRSNSSRVWKDIGTINDVPGSSPEGLMSIAADNKDNFYAVWLDTRTGNKNQVYFAALSGKAPRWSRNTLAYQSPDGHVCECCKPSIAVQGSTIAICKTKQKI